MNRRPRPRLVVVHPYWAFWESTIDPGLRLRRLAMARSVAGSLATAADVVAVAELASPEDGRRLADEVGAVDAVLVLQTMAVPPTHVLPLLEAAPGAGIVVWAAHEEGGVGDAFDHRGITARGATVGAPMLTNVMGRAGRPFEVLLGRLDEPDDLQRVRAAVRAAGAAGALRRSRLGRVGRPIEGYLHVDVDDRALSDALGLEIVAIDPQEVRARYHAATEGEIRALRAELAAWDIDPALDPDSLTRSLRLAAAMEGLVTDFRLDAGALNCHVPEIRFAADIGVTPCYALGRATTQGVPWTCTGDVLTAVAMLTVKRLGAAALYHEVEAVDYDTEEVVLANSGEHDLGWMAPDDRPRLGPNVWFCGSDERCGACAAFEPAPGPATLVGFTPHAQAPGGFRYVVAPGALTARRFPATGTVNGAFRFRSSPVRAAWETWAAAGVNHHGAAVPADIAGAVAATARHLGVEAVEI